MKSIKRPQQVIFKYSITNKHSRNEVTMTNSTYVNINHHFIEENNLEKTLRWNTFLADLRSEQNELRIDMQRSKKSLMTS